MKNKTVSAIVPAYNEGKSVKKIIKTLLSSSLIAEIICINDGSTDNSQQILEEFGKSIHVITFKKNKGKGKAIAAGIKKAKGEYLLFCDSDLIHFTKTHIKAMLNPILYEKTKVVFAVPTLDKTGKYQRHEVFLAGERVYPRTALLPHVVKLARSKGAGGSEIYLNTLFKKKEITIVPLIGLIKPTKVAKWSSPIALKQYMFSIIGILQETGRIEINSVSDLKQLENLVQIDTVENLVLALKEIKNKKIRELLEKYYKKYITQYLKKIL